MINKMNKKGFVFSGTLVVLLVIIGVVVILPLLVSGGLAVPALSKIPSPIWVLLGIILLFKMIGGKKK